MSFLTFLPAGIQTFQHLSLAGQSCSVIPLIFTSSLAGTYKYFSIFLFWQRQQLTLSNILYNSIPSSFLLCFAAQFHFLICAAVPYVDTLIPVLPLELNRYFADSTRERVHPSEKTSVGCDVFISAKWASS